MTAPHAPVLLAEAVDALAPRAGGLYVDGTLGAGGYTRAILARADCRVIAFDRDPTAVARAAGWASAYAERLVVVEAPFGAMEAALSARGVTAIDGAVFDIGVSSMQIDDAERGFSFMRDGPLSMRMDCGKPDAADVVNRAEADDLAAIFRVYGEEKDARRIARAIVAARAEAPIETTGRLAAIVEAASPRRHGEKTHPATRVFQALRIFVNDELGELVRALEAAERLLRPSGRLVVVSFHSLEDRIVKRFFAERSGRQSLGSRHTPAGPPPPPATFSLLTKKAVEPSAEEVAANPRARSAKLRAGVRTDAAPSAPNEPSDALPQLILSQTLDSWSRS